LEKRSDIRHFCKRMGRLTYCFSKRWGNHRAAMGLLFANYNFCKKHRSLKGRTPAQAHGLTDHLSFDETIVCAGISRCAAMA
jgi:hypothetical protein